MRYLVTTDDETLDVTDRIVVASEQDWLPNPDAYGGPSVQTLNDLSLTHPWDEDNCIARDETGAMFLFQAGDLFPVREVTE